MSSGLVDRHIAFVEALRAAGLPVSLAEGLDAVSAIAVPVVEVHISNIFAREDFRHHSHIAPVAKASLCGFGVGGYALAIDGLAALIGARRKSSKP